MARGLCAAQKRPAERRLGRPGMRTAGCGAGAAGVTRRVAKLRAQWTFRALGNRAGAVSQGRVGTGGPGHPIPQLCAPPRLRTGRCAGCPGPRGKGPALCWPQAPAVTQAHWLSFYNLG